MKRVAVFLLFLVFLVGCAASDSADAQNVGEGDVGEDSSGTAATGEVKEFDIYVTAAGYDPEAIEVDLGDTVYLTVYNVDTVDLGFGSADFGISEDLIWAGDSKEFSFVADYSGYYSYDCFFYCDTSLEGTIFVSY
jgi:plastocyanin